MNCKRNTCWTDHRNIAYTIVIKSVDSNSNTTMQLGWVAYFIFPNWLQNSPRRRIELKEIYLRKQTKQYMWSWSKLLFRTNAVMVELRIQIWITTLRGKFLLSFSLTWIQPEPSYYRRRIIPMSEYKPPKKKKNLLNPLPRTQHREQVELHRSQYTRVNTWSFLFTFPLFLVTIYKWCDSSTFLSASPHHGCNG